MKIPGYPNISITALCLATLGALALAGCESYDPVPNEGQTPYSQLPGTQPPRRAEPVQPRPQPQPQPQSQPSQPAEQKEPFSQLASATASTMDDPYFPSETRPERATAATVESARRGVVPQAPYQSTPSYSSAYDEYWSSPESIQANRARLQQDQRDGLAVTDTTPAASPGYSSSGYSSGSSMPSGTAGSQTLYSSRTGSEGYTPGPRSYSDLGASAGTYSQPATTYAQGSASAGSGLPEIPPAPDTLPSGSQRYVTADGEPYPEIGSDGLPIYAEQERQPAAVSPMRVNPSLSNPYDSDPARGTRPAPSQLAPSQTAPSQTAPSQTAPSQAADSSSGSASTGSALPTRPDMTGGATMPARDSVTMPSYSQPAVASRPTGGNYAVHLASYRVRDHAINGWNILMQAHPAELAPLSPVISADEIPGLGLHYRLKAGPVASESEARALCERIKAGNGDYCAVMSYSGEPF